MRLPRSVVLCQITLAASLIAQLHMLPSMLARDNGQWESSPAHVREWFDCYPELKTWDDGSWTQKTFSLVAGAVFAVVALFHLVRIFMEWTIIIGDWLIPMWASWIALVIAGGLALLGLRLSERRQGDG